MSSGHISVKNFGKFQHYKDRTPPWIKLYNDLLDDYEFGLLPDVSKAHLIAIWLLASRYNNQIPLDAAWISKRINATENINLEILEEAGFILISQGCSRPLAECSEISLEREREEEGESYSDTNVSADKPPDDPVEDALDIPLMFCARARDDVKGALFSDGLRWLERRCEELEQPLPERSLLGMWLQKSGQDAEALWRLFCRAQSEKIGEPVSWISAAVDGSRQGGIDTRSIAREVSTGC